MATKNETVLNKSQEIRKALARYRGKGPTEIARLLTEQHGVPFRPKMVSTIKAGRRGKPAPAPKPAAPVAARRTAAPRPQTGSGGPAPAGGVAGMVANLQAYIQRLGKADLHRLIDTL